MSLKTAAIRVWKAIRRRGGSARIRITQDGKSKTLDAAVGRTSIDIDEGEGIFQSYEDRDFLIVIDHLDDFGRGGPHRIKAGALIEEIDDNDTLIKKYTARHRGGARHYEYSDPFHTVMRIHTVESHD